MTVTCDYCRGGGTNRARIGTVPCGECEGRGVIDVCPVCLERLPCENNDLLPCESEQCLEAATCDTCHLHFDVCACGIDPQQDSGAQ